MDFDYYSQLMPRENFAALLSFAAQALDTKSRPDDMVVMDNHETGTHGYTFLTDAGEIVVVLLLPTTKRNYPHNFTYTVGAVVTRWDSVEEEVLHFIAHELRHVEQWRTGVYATDAEAMESEVDAEVHAQAVVEAYRSRRLQQAA